MNKFKLYEENELELEPAQSPQNLDDVYAELGDDLFNDENIGYLKASGNINNDGYPVSFYPEDGQLEIWNLDRLYDYDFNFIKNNYIKNLIVQEFNNKYPEGLEFELTSDNIPSLNTREISDEFLQACLEEDVWDYFYHYGEEIDFDDCDYYIDNIDTECLDLLENMGFPRDIYTQLINGTEDEEHPLSEYYDELKDIFTKACADGIERGAETDCLNDFDSALKNLDIPGIQYKGRQEPEYHTVKYLITQDFVKNNVENIWDRFDNYSFTSAIEQEFLDEFSDNLEFYEPYSGWNGFDEDMMNESLLNFLSELKYEINKKVDKEMFGEDKLFKIDNEGNIIPNEDID